ncbi:sensor histidine kinase [Puia dinghuensis]|uniref:histidine kinase n=1 Tax=Puia dinghuensis TaxID=1792502 RepID=A0A8J2U7M4_9BACT|nr:sensor histidine kinase [Puia dinghuensis]GGA84805.1 hypothetical protein GCM10011511_04790 [Puia dinghuensis]
MPLSRYWYAVLLVFFTAPARAQLYPFKNFSEKDGLSYQNITAAMEDGRGLLWVGTPNGINWFDGKNFYEPPIAASSGYLNITNLYKDLRNNIWMMTFYDGIYRFSGNRFTRFLPDSVHPESICNNVFDFLQLKDSSYICLTDMNVFAFDGKHFSLFDPDNTALQTACYSIAALGDGSLLLGTNSGLFHYTLEKGKWRLSKSLFRQLSITRITTTRQAIWLGTQTGLFKFNSLASLDRQTPDLYLFDKEYITSMAHIGDDSIWVFGKRLYLINKETIIGFGQENGLPASYVNFIYCDSRGISWFCTNNGLSRLGQVYYQFDDMEKYLPGNNSMTRLAIGRDSTLWVGTQNGLLYREKNNRGFNSIYEVAHVAIGFISWFCQDPNGDLWTGSSSGILKITGRSVSRVSSLHSVSQCKGADGGSWLADIDGNIWWWKGATMRQVSHAAAHQDDIYSLYFDTAKYLWAGFRNSGIKVFHWDHDSLTTIKTYGPADGFTNLRIRCFLGDGRGHLLAGTRTSGIYIFSLKNDSIPCHLDNRQGLKASWIKELSKSGDTIYIATNNGIYSLTGNCTSPSIKQLHFDKAVVGNESGSVLACGPYFYIANKGIMKYYPKAVVPDTLCPPVYFTQLLLGGMEDSTWLPYTVAEKHADLDYAHHTVSFQFTGINLLNADQLRYQYMLEGLDTGWGLPTSRNNVNYNLKPGRYTFRVRALNEAGGWSPHPAAVSFYIHSPFWLTWWFFVLLALALAWVVYTIYRYQLKSALRLEQLRNKISADLHDDMGSSLSSISILSEVASREDEQKSRHIIREINERSLLLMEKMDDIVWSISQKNDTVGNLMSRIQQFASTLLEAKEIEYEVKIPEQVRTVRLDMLRRQHIYLILKEAINNLVKYSCCRSVCISTACTGRTLTISVADDGKGFHRESIRRGNGLLNMEKRAGAIDGELSIASVPGKGTRVTLAVEIE